MLPALLGWRRREGRANRLIVVGTSCFLVDTGIWYGSALDGGATETGSSSDFWGTKNKLGLIIRQ
jgi:hypothetical protein